MKIHIPVALLFLLYTLGVKAQNDSTDDTRYRLFQATFVYPMGTSGPSSSRTIYNVSVNALTGVTGGVDGIEISGLINNNTKYVEGAQFAGIGNVTNGYIQAAQFGGIYNIVGQSSEGFQAGGIFNIINGSMEGVQVAGIKNACRDMEGVQIGGIINIAKDVEGAQIGGIINKAKNVEGIQLAGIINICDSIDGIPIAPINYVRKNGYRRFEISSNEMFDANISYKIGVRQLYTFITFGVSKEDTPFNSAYGLGIGSNMKFNKFFSIDFEGLYSSINYHWNFDPYNHLTTLRAHAVFNITKRIALFGGPSANLLISSYEKDANRIVPEWSYSYEQQSEYLNYWIGFNAGLRF
ncbi:MAG: hypothetical protein MI922_17855 [Bacteroidales bacterium]|nr:hypothetical protein [Bacteroidales bacterium]